ncbi:hypothetical protein [Paraburkholderia sediminicola]|uniref:hypothetical protein n=1 Tax=Paraburkholderia sediminicola TaxID=458836 RepID=UPI0038BD9765
MTKFSTLSQALQKAIQGARVTHALFTTYGFEPEFFEANVVPILLDCQEGMSVHTAVRRLQLNEKMCAMPPAALPQIEVFFDEGVSASGVPWLPYALQPMRQRGAFHGKVILLRLEPLVPEHADMAVSEARWVLGCGSANLTLSGWWENIEAWHFTAPFAASSVPAGLFDDLSEMMNWLRSTTAHRNHPVLDRWTSDQPRFSSESSGQRFVALLPGRESGPFAERFKAELDRVAPQRGALALEVVSPYFCDDGQHAFTQQLCERLAFKEVRVWLPIDAWSDGAGLLTREQYAELRKQGAGRWSAFVQDNALGRASVPTSIVNLPQRTTHAKVLRVPEVLTFMGSVNFSRAAFDINFEAGFFFDGGPRSWLEPTSHEPPVFERTEAAPGETGNALAECPQYEAFYDWETGGFCVSVAGESEARYANATVVWHPSDEPSRVVPIALGVAVKDRALGPYLAAYATIPLEWHSPAGERGSVNLWVHQANLQWRPVPPELKLDVWSMIDLWRSTRGERIAGNLAPWARIEERLAMQESFAPDAPAASSQREDIFAKMTHIHGAFQGLRRTLLPTGLNDADAQARARRARYYLCTERADSLPTMLDRIANDTAYVSFDEVERWVVLHWIKQIALDHPDTGAAVLSGTDALILQTRAEKLSEVEADRLNWLTAAFLNSPDDEPAPLTAPLKEEA